MVVQGASSSASSTSSRGRVLVPSVLDDPTSTRLVLE
jgi:hypothetical protein